VSLLLNKSGVVVVIALHIHLIISSAIEVEVHVFENTLSPLFSCGPRIKELITCRLMLECSHLQL